MTKVTSSSNENERLRIDKESVAKFFRERAKKIQTVGTMRAVIYQDKHPDLAEKRDVAEKTRLLPLLKLDGSQRLLDVGCGTGRWTPCLVDFCAYYHGIDFSAELIEHARAANPPSDSVRFSVAPAENYSLDSLHGIEPFDRILCCGVMIYLNDDDVESAFRCMASVAANKTRILLREPVGRYERLTLKDHFSDELNQRYNAIYRTQQELEQHMTGTLFASGFRLVQQGDVFEAELNNRSETIQRWMLLERS